MTHTRATCTLGRERCTPETLAQAVHCVARHSPLSAHDIVAELGRHGNACSYDWFIKATADSGRCAAPGWLLLALAVTTGRVDHLRYLAHEAGLLTYHAPLGPSATRAALSPVLRRFTAMVEEWEGMHADGVVSEAEATNYTTAAAELLGAVLVSVNQARSAAGLRDLSTLSKEPAV